MGIRPWAYLLNAVNFPFNLQVSMSYESATKRSMIVNIFYWLCLVVSVFMIVRSHNRKYLKYTYYGLLIAAYRNALPLLDLDGVDSFITHGNGEVLLVTQVAANVMNVLMLNTLDV